MTGPICACLFVTTLAILDAGSSVDAATSAASGIGTVGILKEWGPAGLIGLMWLYERRDARRRDAVIAKRDEQLDAAHERIMADESKLDVMVAVVKQNTASNTKLVTLIEQLVERQGDGS